MMTYEDMLREGVVASTPAFQLTKESIWVWGALGKKLRLSDIAFVHVRDNRNRVNIGRWIAVIAISTAIFICDRIRKGYIDVNDLFVVPLVVAGIAFLIGLGFRKTELIVITMSGEDHNLATVDGKDISLEDVHRWCGIIAATRVDWKREAQAQVEQREKANDAPENPDFGGSSVTLTNRGGNDVYLFCGSLCRFTSFRVCSCSQ